MNLIDLHQSLDSANLHILMHVFRRFRHHLANGDIEEILDSLIAADQAAKLAKMEERN